MFKEAWYHDFAPPIHSLDRHGDFAPPLTKFNEEAGFIESLDSPDGCAIRYNILNGVPPRCNGWLYVATTAINGYTGDTGIGQAVVFVIPDTALASGLVTSTAAGDTIFDAWADNAGSYGMDLRAAGAAGQLQFTSPFEYHDIGGGIFRLVNSSLVEINADVTTIISDKVSLEGSSSDADAVNTSGNVAVGLAAGETFTVFDHNTVPIVTYTG